MFDPAAAVFESLLSFIVRVSYRIITHMTNCHTSILVNCIYCYSSAFTTSLCPRNSPLPRQIATNNAHRAANTCRLIINTCCVCVGGGGTPVFAHIDYFIVTDLNVMNG